MDRREFLIGTAAAVGTAALPIASVAAAPISEFDFWAWNGAAWVGCKYGLPMPSYDDRYEDGSWLFRFPSGQTSRSIYAVTINKRTPRRTAKSPPQFPGAGFVIRSG